MVPKVLTKCLLKSVEINKTLTNNKISTSTQKMLVKLIRSLEISKVPKV